jgi:dienelactone hydrolase
MPALLPAGVLPVVLALLCGAVSPLAASQEPAAAPALPEDISYRADWIRSEGVRMSAEVYAPRSPGTPRLPAIIMCHGWGGLAEQLRPDAIAFARAGYLVVVFDYRGWGRSDGRLVLSGSMPARRDGKLMAEVQELRGVVDPIEQTTDLLNAIHWTQAETLCDPARIGLWGSSFSGGHVVYAAARDPRVKAIVSQVGSMDSRWAVSGALRGETYRQGTARTRGKLDYPAAGARFGTLHGAPILEKMSGYAPIEDIGRCEKVAKLFIIAELEELMDNRQHSILAYERATGVKKLATLKGIKHYGVYNEKRSEAQRLAIEWFDEHLRR